MDYLVSYLVAVEIILHQMVVKHGGILLGLFTGGGNNNNNVQPRAPMVGPPPPQ